ncbi:MAG TPA: RidA family protein [Planctomycetaceae bacterium]|nr:RidA family protein [Planctomycetaceae bacterium]
MLSFTGSVALALCLTADARVIEGNPKTGQAQAVVVANEPLLFTSQLLPAGPRFAPTPPDDQVHDVFRQLDGLLPNNRLVKLNVYVHEPSITPLVTKQLVKRFAGEYQPAVTFVQTALPGGGVVVGLDAVMTVGRPPSEGMVRREKPAIKGQPAPAAHLPAMGVVYISGQAERGDGTLADATKRTMESLFNTLKFLEQQPSDVVHIKAFLTPMKDSAVAVKDMVAAFGDTVAPPISLVEWKSSLPIEIEMVVASPLRADAPRIEFLTTPEMKASPVFARVTRINQPGQIFLGGLLGRVETPDSITETRETFTALKRITEAAGSDLRHLAKATYYVADDDISNRLNEIRTELYDPERPPAASKAMIIGTGQPPHRLTLDMIAVPKGGE